MKLPSVVVVGAGVGGLCCAISLAARGARVVLLESADGPGGRMRVTRPGGQPVDSGPTVLTLAAVFEELFAQAGERLQDHLQFDPLPVLARHAWSDGGRLDLHADPGASLAAIRTFAGATEARGFERFCRDNRRLYHALDASFMRSPRPGLLQLALRLGPLGAWQLRAGQPFRSLWSNLGRYFRDPRLRQLFGRYATYVGSSPFAAPAVLMLIAQVEMEGVHAVRGGMIRLAEALAALAARHGTELCYRQQAVGLETSSGRVSGVRCADGSVHRADAVVFNGDPAALPLGALGEAGRRALPARRRETSLSALTLAWTARASGFPLAYHSVFFADDYAAEFSDLFAARRLPRQPTVYLCAQDRGLAAVAPQALERVFAIVNAPSLDGTPAPAAPAGAGPAAAHDAARRAALDLLQRCGLRLDIEAEVQTAPDDFARRFPGSDGALYGPPCHGWYAPFERPGARTRLPGLYLAGGSVHPGPGVPMVAISGRLAADAVLADGGC